MHLVFIAVALSVGSRRDHYETLPLLSAEPWDTRSL